MILSINSKIERLIMDKDYYIGLRIYQEKLNFSIKERFKAL